MGTELPSELPVPEWGEVQQSDRRMQLPVRIHGELHARIEFHVWFMFFIPISIQLNSFKCIFFFTISIYFYFHIDNDISSGNTTFFHSSIPIDLYLYSSVISKYHCFARAPRVRPGARRGGSARTAARRAAASTAPRATMSLGGGRGHLSVEHCRLSLAR